MAKNIIIGIGGHVVALRPEDGSEVWRSKIASGHFCSVAEIEGRIYAGVNGQVYCLDPATGTVLWNNKLKRLGMGFVTFAGSSMEAAAGAQTAANVAVMTAAT